MENMVEPSDKFTEVRHILTFPLKMYSTDLSLLTHSKDDSPPWRG